MQRTVDVCTLEQTGFEQVPNTFYWFKKIHEQARVYSGERSKERPRLIFSNNVDALEAMVPDLAEFLALRVY